MIDFHTHILPRIDDGSRDLGMTEAMLREEGRQGVRLVIATPHFYADEMSIDGFLERRAMAMAETEGVRRKAEETLPAVLAGAEVRYFDGIGAAKEIAALCVEGTKTMLLELPVEQWGQGVLKDVEALVEKRKLTVVLAHVERSFPFQRDRSVWDRVMSLPLMLYYPAEWVCARWSDVIITINREDYERTKRRFHRCDVLYTPGVGVDLERFHAPARDAARQALGFDPDDFVLLSVGELIPRKNHRAILEALSLLRQKGRLHGITFVLCGSGALEAALRRRATELGLGDHVRFMGYCDQVPQVMAAADMFLLPSLQEGLPVALMEAMAAGLPSACLAIRGNTDLIRDEENGLLLRDARPETLAAAIERLKNDPALGQRLGESALRTVQGFSLPVAMRGVRDLYAHWARELSGQKRIAMLMPVGGAGGVQTVMINLANGLSQEGCAVTILCADNSQGLPGIREARVIDLGMTSLQGDYKVAAALGRVRAYIRHDRPHGLITAPGFSGQVGILACRGTETKTVVMVDDKLSLLRRSSLKHRLSFGSAMCLYRRADRIVAAHDAALADARACLDLDASKKLIRIYHPIVPVDIDARMAAPCPVSLPHGEPLVMAAGRLVEEKGFDTLIRAFAEVHSVLPCKLIILGEGPLRTELERLTRTLDLEGEVLLPGRVENVFPCFARASVFVLSSRREAFGNVLVEALACGVPCVAAACASGGPQEILANGRYGTLVPVDDADQLAHAIRTVLQQGGRADEDARLRGRSFGADVSAKAYLEAIEACSR